MDKLVSVIVPVYNVEPYIDKMLTSVCGQTYENLEILLIDDGSTDRSGQLCDSWQQKDDRIRVFHQENQGVSAARNKGLDEATGAYIMFADPDDWLDRDIVQILYELLTEQKVDISCCYLREVYEGSEPETSTENCSNAIKRVEGKAESGLVLLQPWAPYCKLYRSELLRNIRFQPYRIAEDLLFNTDVICNTKFGSIASIDRKMYNYLIRNNSAMKQKFHEKYMEGMRIEGDCYRRLTAISKDFGEINLVGCGVSLVFEKYARLSAAEKRENKAYFTECKKYAKEYKAALLGCENKHRKISGALKVYVPNLYMILLSLRYKLKG